MTLARKKYSPWFGSKKESVRSKLRKVRAATETASKQADIVPGATAMPGSSCNHVGNSIFTNFSNFSTVILRWKVMSALVEGLGCTLCGCSTLIIRPVNCNLGLDCLLQTYCTSCNSVLQSTYSSDRHLAKCPT